MNQTHTLPKFTNIETKDIVKNIETILKENKQQISLILENNNSPSWENLIEPLDNCNEKLHSYWSIVSHLHSVADNAKLRSEYEACLPMISAYYSDICHNEKLYDKVRQLQETIHVDTNNKHKKRAVDNEVRDFKLSGVALNHEDKKRHKELSEQLSKYTSTFSQNVLDATDNWFFHATEESQIKGIPEHAIAQAKQLATNKKLTGWVFNLQAPSFIAVMSYADNDELRRQVYEAFVTRASNKGPNASRWDNTPIIKNILQTRQDISKILGFKNYAEYSLQTKMVKKTNDVIKFLDKLCSASYSKAKQEMKALTEFATKEGAKEKLQPWQIGYYTEKLRQDKYNFSAEDLRPYFPMPQVLKGLFDIAAKLYNIRIEKIKSFDSWHQDVTCYAIYDNTAEATSEKPRAYFYLDPYAREHKRGGAWMDDCQSRRLLPDKTILAPIAFLVCNFAAPETKDKPALLTHDDVVTLFHEFGHGLHHMLTKIDLPSLSGINGVAWDAVELPSQFMENWAYEKTSLDLFAKHYATGEPLPDTLYNKMIRARNFHSAMQMMRQLEFSLFDFELHQQSTPYQENTAAKTLTAVRHKTRVTPTLESDCFQNSFSHIFAGGYAAGYYSYKWAEVMAADAYSVFKNSSPFEQKHSQKFLTCILEKGGSEDAAKLFHDFRGRDPDISALLEQEGIINE